jgi:hypothetical protein
VNERRALVLHAFLGKRSSEERSLLERFLPEEERSFLSTLSPATPSESEPLVDPLVDQVHWSWFLPTLKTFSDREQGLFLSSLQPSAASSLAQALGLTQKSESLTHVAKTYFREQLLNSLVGSHEELLPPPYLPSSPLNGLLSLTKKQLTQLIDRLALYDVAAELKHIVDTQTIKKISGCLTPAERERLKVLKEFHPLPRLGLDQWDGSEEAFRSLLHKRGLQRLGIALSGQDADLVWALCHRLDIGRGNALFKFCGKEAVPMASDMIQRELEEFLR